MSHPDDTNDGNQTPNDQGSANGWSQNSHTDGTGSGPAAYPNQPQPDQPGYAQAASDQSDVYHPINEAQKPAVDYQREQSYQGQPYGQQPQGQQPGYNQQQPYGQQSNEQQYYGQQQTPYGQNSNPGQANGQPNGTTPPAGYASDNSYQSPEGWSQAGYQSGYQAGYQPGPQVPQYPAYPYADAGFNGEPPLNAPWYGIDFVNACKRFFVKYSVFSGRASRGEFWWAFLMIFLIDFAVSIITSGSIFVGRILSFLVALGLFIPNLAVSIRRLHDTNMSGFWILLPFVGELVGCIPLVFALAAIIDGNPGSSLSLLGLGVLIMIAGAVAGIVLLARPSDPRGARFDR
ncbi:DUF805 domain-containing protein [Bifidobacterium sp. wkB338]|uniref:DUF805 domain-containing protein n=1 Tax=Bifidobacterium sp. wkB338 TaxID=2025114 RepID=UPI0016053A0C|nr:DUF805 domain-containing protein [Bifidobacterium sp. wkB338]